MVVYIDCGMITVVSDSWTPIRIDGWPCHVWGVTRTYFTCLLTVW